MSNNLQTKAANLSVETYESYQVVKYNLKALTLCESNSRQENGQRCHCGSSCEWHKFQKRCVQALMNLAAKAKAYKNVGLHQDLNVHVAHLNLEVGFLKP